MPSRNVSQNPVFRELAEIQRYTDVDPNPEDSDFSTCRARRRDGGRCRNPPCTQYERWRIPPLLAEFRDMTECPDTDSFHDKMETFVTYTHCKRWHRVKALDAFDEWKRQRVEAKAISRRRAAPVIQPTPAPAIQSIPPPTIWPLTAATLQLLPQTPARGIPSSASATSDGGSSVDDSVMETRSEISTATTFAGSLPNTPLRNGGITIFSIRDIVEEEAVEEEEEIVTQADVTMEEAAVAVVEEETVEQTIEEEIENVKKETPKEDVVKQETSEEDITRRNAVEENEAEKTQNAISTTGIQNTTVEKKDSSETKETIIEGLGITGLQRNGSLRDHSPVFRVINSHPTHDKMKEGVVYILEHKENPSLFKIGWSSKSAEERLRQPNNCYGINTKIIYETKRFCGAPQAEKIAQVILRHANIRVLECDHCKGGHREWFAAQRETVCETVMHVEEFVQIPAYTLQDGEYKLSPEAYDRVVKQMCNFSVLKLGELMRGPRKGGDDVEASSDVLNETVATTETLVADIPLEVSRPNTSNGLSEIQEFDESFISASSPNTKSRKKLSSGAKVARKVKSFLSIKHSVKDYLSRSRESTPEDEDGDRRSFGTVFVDLKDKAREVGTKARQEAREFRRDFKEELHRKDEQQME